MIPLIGGPYAAPPCERGQWLDDAIDGLVQVGGMTEAPIPWPRRKKTGKASLILTGDLIRALEIESELAIAEHWGVGVVTVWKWRKAVGVGRINDGTRELLRERTGVPPEAAARGRAIAASADSRAKMAESKRGRAAHPKTAEALANGREGPKPDGWGARAHEWMTRAKKPSSS